MTSLMHPSTWPGIGRLFAQRTKANDVGSSVVVRASQSLGLWQGALGGFIPREVNPAFYEALREALPILDGAINRMVTLDGIVRVEGGNDAIVQEIEQGLLESIPVNDAEAGLQAAYSSQGNELYEQGLGLIEMAYDRRGRELVGLRVADSKGVAFDRDPASLQLRWWYRPPAPATTLRRDGTDQVEAVIRNRGVAMTAALLQQHSYARLDPTRCVYASHQPEADNPYGVSLMRSMEFVSQILLKIQNATGAVWDRFGDPPYQLTYKVKNRAIASDQNALDKRQKKLAQDLAQVLNAKRNGNSADFVQAIAADDEIAIAVIGAKDQALEIEMPARHLLEQIVGKTGIPAWLLGLQWTTAERLAQQQSEMVLQESRTRFERRKPGLRRIVEAYLRGRGRTWKPGDWQLVQELPSLHDELKRAQAAFLAAQTELMLNGTLIGRQGGHDLPGTDQGAAKSAVEITADGSTVLRFPPVAAKSARVQRAKAPGDGEPWAETDPQLPLIESATTGTMLSAWRGLETATLVALQLPAGKRAKATGWSFTAPMHAALMQLAVEFEQQQGGEQGALFRGQVDAWLRGVENASAEHDVAAAIDQARKTAADAMRPVAMQRVKAVVARAYRDDILADLAAGEYDGDNPTVIAARLRERFGAHDYDWERLARSEIAQAQVLGKEQQYREMGVTSYEYVTAEDSRVSAICRGHAAGSPYEIGKGPVPMRDSHPNCRCTILGVD